jgi:hypothetical protein
MGLGQKPPEHKPLGKSPSDKRLPPPPIMKSTNYLYIGIFVHILDLFTTAIYGLTLLLNTIFHNKLLLKLEDIINNCISIHIYTSGKTCKKIFFLRIFPLIRNCFLLINN